MSWRKLLETYIYRNEVHWHNDRVHRLNLLVRMSCMETLETYIYRNEVHWHNDRIHRLNLLVRMSCMETFRHLHLSQ
jgi:2-hydroxychromene-2-carboxylate isomerase